MSSGFTRPDLAVEDLDFLDKLIDDYLLFRGFLATRKELLRDKASDKNKKFQVRASFRNSVKLLSFVLFVDCCSAL